MLPPLLPPTKYVTDRTPCAIRMDNDFDESNHRKRRKSSTKSRGFPSTLLYERKHFDHRSGSGQRLDVEQRRFITANNRIDLRVPGL